MRLNSRKELTAQILRDVLDYNPTTGKLYWKERGVELFSSSRFQRRWNTRYAGKEALTTKCSFGYLYGAVFYVSISAHLAAWVIHHGKFPINEIDHINGNKSDNRICNLRDVTHKENGRNQSLSTRNTSNIQGVSWHKRHSMWQASIRVDGKTKYLGIFKNKEEAAHARKLAVKKNGFHENHGKNKLLEYEYESVYDKPSHEGETT